MRFEVAAYTNVGMVKQCNQDGFIAKVAETPFGDVTLAAVADGMGGLSKGELASATVIRAFSKWFDETLPLSLEALNSSVEGFERFVEGQWSGLVQELNLRIMRYGVRDRVSLGTTLTAFLSIGARYSIAHVGDTRVYEVRDEGISVLTEDQTFVRREVKAGRLTLEEAAVHPQRNVLLQCVGASKEVKPEIVHGTIDRHALYLVCSDGFRHELSDEELCARFSPKALSVLRATDSDDCVSSPVEQELEKAARLAMDRGEEDNLTAVIVQVQDVVR